MTKLLVLMFAGGLGALARYGVSEWVQAYYGGQFPWATFVVNASGCFLFGLIWTLAHEKHVLSTEASFILLTGFMGAFTTFSTFAFETSAMLKTSHWLLALGNLALQNIGGILAVFLGIGLARLFLIETE